MAPKPEKSEPTRFMKTWPWYGRFTREKYLVRANFFMGPDPGFFCSVNGAIFSLIIIDSVLTGGVRGLDLKLFSVWNLTWSQQFMGIHALQLPPKENLLFLYSREQWFHGNIVCPRDASSFNPLSPSFKLQILLLCFHTFLTEVVGRSG